MQTNNESKRIFPDKRRQERKGVEVGVGIGTWFVLAPHSSRSAISKQRRAKKTHTHTHIHTGGHGHVQMLLRYQTDFVYSHH